MIYIDPKKLPQRVPYDRYGKGFNDCLDQVLDAVEEKDLVEVVRCKDCECFCEYTDKYVQKVERANGDCFIRMTNSDIEQFKGCEHNDFCSYGKRKGGAE